MTTKIMFLDGNLNLEEECFARGIAAEIPQWQMPLEWHEELQRKARPEVWEKRWRGTRPKLPLDDFS
ncbi:hypothetical protein [Chryseobacterium koreense]|uniref:hypothetical protein n=1 Tax=Chryseobacterium koreense TaxID=232216 RepID=UPI0026EC66E6|nr:hypothetical protein [Chryseobacterium koreense]